MTAYTGIRVPKFLWAHGGGKASLRRSRARKRRRRDHLFERALESAKGRREAVAGAEFELRLALDDQMAHFTAYWHLRDRAIPRILRIARSRIEAREADIEAAEASRDELASELVLERASHEEARAFFVEQTEQIEQQIILESTQILSWASKANNELGQLLEAIRTASPVGTQVQHVHQIAVVLEAIVDRIQPSSKDATMTDTLPPTPFRPSNRPPLCDCDHGTQVHLAECDGSLLEECPKCGRRRPFATTEPEGPLPGDPASNAAEKPAEVSAPDPEVVGSPHATWLRGQWQHERDKRVAAEEVVIELEKKLTKSRIQCQALQQAAGTANRMIGELWKDFVEVGIEKLDLASRLLAIRDALSEELAEHQPSELEAKVTALEELLKTRVEELRSLRPRLVAAEQRVKSLESNERAALRAAETWEAKAHQADVERDELRPRLVAAEQERDRAIADLKSADACLEQTEKECWDALPEQKDYAAVTLPDAIRAVRRELNELRQLLVLARTELNDRNIRLSQIGDIVKGSYQSARRKLLWIEQILRAPGEASTPSARARQEALGELEIELEGLLEACNEPTLDDLPAPLSERDEDETSPGFCGATVEFGGGMATCELLPGHEGAHQLPRWMWPELTLAGAVRRSLDNLTARERELLAKRIRGLPEEVALRKGAGAGALGGRSGEVVDLEARRSKYVTGEQGEAPFRPTGTDPVPSGGKSNHVRGLGGDRHSCAEGRTFSNGSDLPDNSAVRSEVSEGTCQNAASRTPGRGGEGGLVNAIERIAGAVLDQLFGLRPPDDVHKRGGPEDRR